MGIKLLRNDKCVILYECCISLLSVRIEKHFVTWIVRMCSTISRESILYLSCSFSRLKKMLNNNIIVFVKSSTVEFQQNTFYHPINTCVA